MVFFKHDQYDIPCPFVTAEERWVQRWDVMRQKFSHILMCMQDSLGTESSPLSPWTMESSLCSAPVDTSCTHSLVPKPRQKKKKKKRKAFCFGPPKISGLLPYWSKCMCMFQELLCLSLCSVECFPGSVQKAHRYQMPPQSMGAAPLLLLSAYTPCSCSPAYLWRERLSNAPHCISNAGDSHFSLEDSHAHVRAHSCQLPECRASPGLLSHPFLN